MRTQAVLVSIVALLLWGAPAFAGDGAGGPDPGGKWEEFALSVRQVANVQVATAVPQQVGMKLDLPSPAGGFAVMPGGGSVQVDVNGDGTLDSKVKDGQVATLQVKYDDGSTLNYFVRFYRINNAMYFQSVTGATGKAFGESITVIDANCNGSFNDLGKDAVQIGKDRWAAPLGKVACIKDKLYSVKVDARGKSVSLQEYAGEAGTIDMMKSFKGPRAPEYVVLQSGENYFNVSAKGGMRVPCGKYVLVKGRLDNGKKSCDITRGDMKELEVGTGAPCEPEWGPPLRIVFRTKFSEGKLHIDAALDFRGKADERYERFASMTAAPEISVKGKDGSVLKKDRFATG